MCSIRRYFARLKWLDLPVHFVGSIAYYFSDELTESANSLGLTVGRILRAPMEGLTQ